MPFVESYVVGVIEIAPGHENEDLPLHQLLSRLIVPPERPGFTATPLKSSVPVSVERKKHKVPAAVVRADLNRLSTQLTAETERVLKNRPR